MNKKPMILAVASLGSVALIGTGFAGWVISTTATATAEGSITAYTVTDTRVRIDAEAWDVHPEGHPEQTSIIFGKPSDASASSYRAANPGATQTWLSAESDVEVERLSAVYSILGWTSTNANPAVSANTFTVTDVTGDKYAAALTAGYLAGPAVGVSQELTTDSDAPVYYEVAEAVAGDFTEMGISAESGIGGRYFMLKVHFNFGWGERFGGINPFNYFAQFGADDTNDSGEHYADIASNGLNAIKDANAASFSFTITLAAGAEATASVTTSVDNG